ncbi:unnamed protein product [Lampetra fluviatilis]
MTQLTQPQPPEEFPNGTESRSFKNLRATEHTSDTRGTASSGRVAQRESERLAPGKVRIHILGHLALIYGTAGEDGGERVAAGDGARKHPALLSPLLLGRGRLHCASGANRGGGAPQGEEHTGPSSPSPLATRHGAPPPSILHQSPSLQGGGDGRGKRDMLLPGASTAGPCGLESVPTPAGALRPGACTSFRAGHVVATEEFGIGHLHKDSIGITHGGSGS